MASVELLKTCVRIVWKIDGKRDRETLHNTLPTPEGKAHAQKIADLITAQIEMGIFDRHQIFPNSSKRPQAYFGYYIQVWQDSEGKTVAPSSWGTYLSKVENHITPYWQNVQISTITPEKFEHWVYKVLLSELSPKTIADIVRLWRNIWTYWARHERNPNDPTQYIKLSQRDPDDIDPYNKAEIHTILTTETDRTLRNLWVVMLWSGLSTHELLPLSVSDLDLANGYAYIQRGFVKGVHRATKTRRRKRQIELLPIVITALADQVAHVADNPVHSVAVLDRDHITTHNHNLQWLWYDPRTNTHFTYSQLSRRWKAHLKRCNIRYRPLNNGRDTYASQVLSTGSVTAEWLANQLGHVDTDMIHKHYGKIIPKDSKHIITQLNNALTQTHNP